MLVMINLTMYYKKSNYLERVKRVQQLLPESDVGTMIIPPGPNFTYLTGMDTESMERLALLILTETGVSILCPELMKQQVIEESWITDIVSWKDDENPYNKLKKFIPVKNKISIEGSLPYFHYERIKPFILVKEHLADSIMTKLRISKDKEELDSIRSAIDKSEKSLSASLAELKEGISEAEFATILENEMKKQGLDTVAFSSIVSFGKNAALPHHSPDSTRLKHGDSIVIDFGGRYHYYASDTTRTFFWKHADPEMETIYETVRQANEQARLTITKETSYAEMDATARSIIEKAGYGKNFFHRLGHGLGLQVHEEPYLVPSNTQKAITNSVFTIEPGIYITGKGGVRIEDTNYFDGSKCVSFNSLSREFTVLE